DLPAAVAGDHLRRHQIPQPPPTATLAPAPGPVPGLAGRVLGAQRAPILSRTWRAMPRGRCSRMAPATYHADGSRPTVSQFVLSRRNPRSASPASMTGRCAEPKTMARSAWVASTAAMVRRFFSSDSGCWLGRGPVMAAYEWLSLAETRNDIGRSRRLSAAAAL